MATGANEVEQLGELDNNRVVVHLVERVLLEEVLVEGGLELEASQLVVLLHDLDETSEVELREQRKVVDISHKDCDLLLELLEALLNLVEADVVVLLIVSDIVIVRTSVVVAVAVNRRLSVTGRAVVLGVVRRVVVAAVRSGSLGD